MQLKNKKIVITGGSDGLGFSLAKAFITKGALISLIARNKDKLDFVVNQLGPNATGFVADVSSYQAIKKVAEKIGTIDILINNAGVWLEGSLIDNKVASIDQVIDTNLKGVIYATKAFLTNLQKPTESHICNIISSSGLKGRAGQTTYCASKFGVAGFTEALKIDLENTNIKVSALYPGGMNTQFFSKANNPKDNQDWLNTDKVAEIITFMLERDVNMVMEQVTLNKRLV